MWELLLIFTIFHCFKICVLVIPSKRFIVLNKVWKKIKSQINVYPVPSISKIQKWELLLEFLALFHISLYSSLIAYGSPSGVLLSAGIVLCVLGPFSFISPLLPLSFLFLLTLLSPDQLMCSGCCDEAIWEKGLCGPAQEWAGPSPVVFRPQVGRDWSARTQLWRPLLVGHGKAGLVGITSLCEELERQ